VQPVGLALALGDLRLAIPRQGAQLALGLGRHEAAAQQPGLHQLTQPLRVGHVGLAARHVLDVPGVAQRQLEVLFEDVPDGLPIHAGGLHRDMRDAVRRKPVVQRHQALHGRLKLRQVRHAAPRLVRDPHARGHLRLVNIERADALKDRLHRLPLHGRTPRSCRPAGPSKQTSLMVMLKATVRDPGEGPCTKLTTGTQAPRRNAASTSDPWILAHFIRPRMAEGHGN